jgi:leucyl aminopeptidase
LTAAAPTGGVPGLASEELLASLGFKGTPGELVRIPRAAISGKLAAPTLAVAGVGTDRSPTQLRRAYGAALRQLGAVESVGCATPPDIGSGADAVEILAAAAEGALLGAHDAVRLVFAGPSSADKAAKQAVNRAQVLAQAVRAARRLVDEPPNRLYPEAFADAAVTAAKGVLKARVLDVPALTKAGYGGILAVGQGSTRPPRLVVLTHSPTRARHHIALVGKGITFDSGGLDIKTAAGMATMKCDMAGAAAVLHATVAAATLKLPVKVTGYLCLAENMPSGAALRPSDVITMKDGRAVEVANTDAEGRLVLADGIAAALEAKADQVIDIATLTGAQVVALGNRIAGVMGSETVRDGIVRAAAQAGEDVWPMPLPADLLDGLKSEVADLASLNLTDRAAGMLSAGVFLQQFAGDVPWAHIDIAGPAFNSGEPWGLTPKGGTGFGVATLLAYLEDAAS